MKKVVAAFALTKCEEETDDKTKLSTAFGDPNYEKEDNEKPKCSPFGLPKSWEEADKNTKFSSPFALPKSWEEADKNTKFNDPFGDPERKLEANKSTKLNDAFGFPECEVPAIENAKQSDPIGDPERELEANENKKLNSPFVLPKSWEEADKNTKFSSPFALPKSWEEADKNTKFNDQFGSPNCEVAAIENTQQNDQFRPSNYEAADIANPQQSNQFRPSNYEAAAIENPQQSYQFRPSNYEAADIENPQQSDQFRPSNYEAADIENPQERDQFGSQNCEVAAIENAQQNDQFGAPNYEGEATENNQQNAPFELPKSWENADEKTNFSDSSYVQQRQMGAKNAEMNSNCCNVQKCVVEFPDYAAMKQPLTSQDKAAMFFTLLLAILIIAVIVLCIVLPRNQTRMINWFLDLERVSIVSNSSLSNGSISLSSKSDLNHEVQNKYFANKYASNYHDSLNYVTNNYYYYYQPTKVICDEFVSKETASIPKIYTHTAVTTDAAPCATIGKNILEQGGHVVDAAIAALACMGVVNPQSSGIGGGFLMVYYNRSARSTTYIDAREAVPLKATPSIFQGDYLSEKNAALSIAIPGEIRGYEEAHKKFGSLKWEDLFQPTINLCNTGITVSPPLASALKRKKRALKDFEPFKKIFTNKTTNEVLKAGDVYTRPDLAKTLKAIAENKSAAIYDPQSPLAQNLLADLKAKGSILREDDLRNYTSVRRDPVNKTLSNDLTLHSASFPGSGALLAFVLGVLDGYNLTKEMGNSEEATVRNLHRMIETFKFAYNRRMDLRDSPNITKIEQELMSEEYAKDVRSKINDSIALNILEQPKAKTTSVPILAQGDHGTAHVPKLAQGDHGTASLSIVASNGDALSVTSTINNDFGSMVLSPSTGILFNNQMDVLLSSNISNTVQPGRRIFSSMTPVIVTDAKGDVVMVMGGNGGMKITSSLAQAIIRNLWLDESLREAVDAPRLHHLLSPNITLYEKGFREVYIQGLRDLGHDVQLMECGTVGSIVGVVRRGSDLYAISDYRKGGDVDGY